MKNYFKLILEKQKRIEKMKEEIKELDLEIEQINIEVKQIDEIDHLEYEVLDKLQGDEQEFNQTIFVIAISLILLFISLLACFYLPKIEVSVFNAFLRVFGFNFLQMSLSFMAIKLIRNYHQKRREKNKEAIQEQFDVVMSLNKKREKVHHKQLQKVNQRKSFAFQIQDEQMNIENMKKELATYLLKIYQEKREELQPLLDQLIDLDIQLQEENLLDTDLQRKRIKY